MALPTLPHPLPGVQDVAPASTSNPVGTAATCRFVVDNEDVDAQTLNRPAYALSENDAFLEQKSKVVTAGPTGETADYTGTSAVVDAITDIIADGDPTTLLVLPGTYDGPGAEWDLSLNGLVIKGYGGDGSDVIIDVTEGDNVRVTGDFIRIEGIYFRVSGAGSSTSFTVEGVKNVIKRCTFESLLLDISGSFTHIQNIEIAGYNDTIYVNDALAVTDVLLENISIGAPKGGTVSDALIEFGSNVSRVSLRNVSTDTASEDIRGIVVGAAATQLYFENVQIQVNDAVGLLISAGLTYSSFVSCAIQCAAAKALDIQGVVDGSTFYACDFLSTTQSAADIAAAITDNSFQSCHFECGAADALTIGAAITGNSFASCTFLCTSANALSITANIARNSFTSCTFQCGDSTTLLLTGNLENCSFTSCLFECAAGICVSNNDTDVEINQVTFQDCEFKSDEVLLDLHKTYGISVGPMHFYGSFIRCKFENVGSAYYNDFAIRAFSKWGVDTDTTYDFFATNAPLLFDSCVMIDVRAKGADTTTDPGVAGSASGPTPVFDFIGASLRNVHIDRSGLAYAMMEGPWLSMTNCIGENISVETPDADPWVWTTPVSTGLLVFLDGTHVKNLRAGSAFSGAWQAPLIYLANQLNYSDTGNWHGENTILDGVQVLSRAGTTPWKRNDSSFSDALVIHIGNDSIVSRFVWTQDDIVGTLGGDTNSCTLVRMEGRGTFENSQIYYDDDGNYCHNLIRALGVGNTIRDNRIYATISGTQVLTNLISMFDDSNVIDGNFIHFDFALTSGDTLVSASSGSHGHRISNNHFISGDCASQQYHLDLTTNCHSTINGNIFQATAGTTTPDVNATAFAPATLTDTNLLFYDGAVTGPPAATI